jgi:hypothetical protein
MADYVELYAKSLGFAIKPRTVLVEGTTDVDLFRLAARLEYEKSGSYSRIWCTGSFLV